LGIGVIVALLLLVAVGLVYYWVDWKDARGDRRDQSSGDYLKTRKTFLEDIEAARLDAAYQSTTPSFQSRVSRGAFEERVGHYLAFQRKPGTQVVAGRASGPIAGDHRGPNRMALTDTLEDGEGNRLQMSITVMYEDSILYRRPPPMRVGEFTVEEVLPQAPGKP
jgi:hypothetical protein